MAEIQDNSQDSGKKGRAPKASPRVDLTAMVDLAFLLITFFMFTTTLAKPKVMPLVLPDESPINDPPKLDDSLAMTILLAPKNVILYYFGTPETVARNPDAVKTTTYDKQKGIRKILLDKKKRVDAMGSLGVDKEGNSRLMVLIKPSDSSVYGNMVDVLDEMHIAEIKRYALLTISDAEKVLVDQTMLKTKK